METKANEPVHEIKIGMIKATIWANTVPNGVRHNATFARLYKGGDNWCSSSSFGRDDLLILAKVVDAAFEWIIANHKAPPTA